ncbi:MAG: polysaccharide ABC transporter ATP-binding protein [Phycisphaerae bacterium]
MSSYSVRCEGVWKRFRLGAAHASLADMLQQLLVRGLGLRRGQSDAASAEQVFWALQDISFALKPGEAIGVIGPNGAGKSTLLKLLSGILSADRGSYEVTGRLASLIEVGAGFHGDLTGRENIYLNGAILGMSRGEVRSRLDDIVSFAGLERFIDTPVKRYSSGMYARLGFAIAAHVNPDVLLVDEVLSVGDAAFRLRCESRMQALVEGGTSLIFVTHNLEQMQRVCERSLVLEGGRIAFDGDSREAVQHYMTAMAEAFTARPSDLRIEGDGPAIEVDSVEFREATGASASCVDARGGLLVDVGFTSPVGDRPLIVEVAARAAAGENVVCFNSGRSGAAIRARSGMNVCRLRVPSFPVASGRYFWNVRIWDESSGATLVDTPFRYPLIVDDRGMTTGVMSLAHDWQVLPAGDGTGVGSSVGRAVSRASDDAVFSGGDRDPVGDDSIQGDDAREVGSCESA